eukprot:CAMPEP_0119325810 /NCGR_PEP_ID=MMETSP1333-20130426/66732_1 /TAXON_ID=418940 /ORGANISM="Scyphosphaera apsteinii, Strain RCC1455" /LENGTH=428 /DNA_ID=CAMNT_0007333915 /DNA_START=150 /DNA_END=1432 /DNA_ORIENTATION=+
MNGAKRCQAESVVQALHDSDVHAQRIARMPRKKLCCAADQLHSVFIGLIVGSSSATHTRVLNGLVKMAAVLPKARLDFGVVAYDNGAHLWAAAVQADNRIRTQQRQNRPFRPRLLFVKNSGLPKDFGFQPRYMHVTRHFMPELLDAPVYDAVVVPDDDMGLDHFEAAQFFHYWACAFPGGHPLVSQPLIAPATQMWWPMNAESWPLVFGSDLPVAVATEFIEQQFPIFDGRFFVWFMETIGSSIGSAQGFAKTSWGIDAVWCRAASYYLQQILVRPAKTACGLLNVQLAHLDLKTTPRSQSFESNGLRFLDTACLTVQSLAKVEANISWYLPGDVMGYRDGPRLSATFNSTFSSHRSLRRRLLRTAIYRTLPLCISAGKADVGKVPIDANDETARSQRVRCEHQGGRCTARQFLQQATRQRGRGVVGR